MSRRDSAERSLPQVAGAVHEVNGAPPALGHIDEGEPPSKIRSSPPRIEGLGVLATSGSNGHPAGEGSSNAKSDSEAETIVLPGKEDGSTERTRKSIKHEDDSDGEGPIGGPDMEMKDVAPTTEISGNRQERKVRTSNVTGKRKRSKVDNKEGKDYGGGDVVAPNSTLSSHVTKNYRQRDDDLESRSRSSTPQGKSVGSDHDLQKQRPGKVVPGQSNGHLKRGQQQPADSKDTVNNDWRDSTNATQGPLLQASKERSLSPHHRPRRRADSVQSLQPQAVNGHQLKKRRLPPPLHATRESRSSEGDHSESSSGTGSPYAYPHLPRVASGETSMMSPAKMPHKKHRDQIGRTFLARACAADEIEHARTRLAERPEDIDVADNAGNTPLQIAALGGCAPIVELLIEAGCDIHCKNNEKDTPLIDAVENGHLTVVKLLLDAGANPRQGNVNGKQPLDLLDTDDKNHNAIKDALLSAQRKLDLRRQSEDHGKAKASKSKETDRSSRGGSAASTRGSPHLVAPRSPPAASISTRRRTGRNEQTRNDFLFLNSTHENLRIQAGKGDMAAVGNILNVLQKADPESLIAAARGGHDEVMQLLLGMGNADADPSPLRSAEYKAGYNTPMLAAIGQGNEKVLQLLLTQQDFDPTGHDHRGHTYYDIAQERQGPNWEKESAILKEAFDKHVGKIRKIRSGTKLEASSGSPRKHREQDREVGHKSRAISTSPARPPHKKNLVKSPSRSSLESGAIHSRRDSATKDAKNSEKALRRGSTREKVSANNSGPHINIIRDEDTDNSVAVSDRESTPLGPPRATVHRVKGRGSDVISNASDGENSRPRRKLVSGKVLKSDQEKKRKASLVSSVSSESTKDTTGSFNTSKGALGGALTPTQVNASGTEPVDQLSLARSKIDATNPEHAMEKAITKQRPSKRDDSRDRLSAVRGEAGSKRRHSSMSPNRSSSRDSETRRTQTDEMAKKKRRRLEEERNESSNIRKYAKDHSYTPRPAKTANMDRVAETTGLSSGNSEHASSITTAESNLEALDLSKQRKTIVEDTPTVNDEHRKKKPGDNYERELASDKTPEPESGAAVVDAHELEIHPRAPDIGSSETQKAQEENDKQKNEAKKEQEHQAQILRERAAEQARIDQKAEEERRRAEAEREEQARAEKEEADRKARIAREEEALRLEEERRVEEVARRMLVARQEEEARIEKKRRDEEMQKLLRIRREEQDRKRAEHEERERQQRVERQAEEQRIRRQALPNALRKFAELDIAEARTAREVKMWLPLVHVPTNQLDPSCEGEYAYERWIPNYQAATVLGIKDLELSQFTAWTKRSVTPFQKMRLWHLTRKMLAEAVKPTPHNTTYAAQMQLDRETEAKFMAMEPVFWIKLSDFEDITKRFPHLEDINITKRSCQINFFTVPNGSGFIPRPSEVPQHLAAWENERRNSGSEVNDGLAQALSLDPRGIGRPYANGYHNQQQ
ncbi:MAG: Set3 complex subunit with deacetylase activity, meiotic-specific repressor of sporulation proteins [Pycnora praestabilis]|nr:MAG: Set3 complex subunit with deacetylase activity, meiotic-specific repressor of sporulation proteins [Pycnora praestabilis]